MRQYELRAIVTVNATDGIEARKVVQGLQSYEPRIASIRFKGFDYLRRVKSDSDIIESNINNQP